MATSTQNQLPEYYAEEIQRIGNNFADNFKRAFNNEGIRLRKAHKSIELENVGFSFDNIYVDLSDIKLNYPEFRVNYMNIDLEQGIINYKLTVGKLLFRSKLQNVTITRFKGLYVHAAAKLQWTLHKMNITGSAGLFRVGDSFVAKNNRNLYYFEKGEIEQFVEDQQLPETTSFRENDVSLFRILQASVYAALSSKIKRQMDVITEFSASELLLDESEEIDKYDEYLGRRTLRANLLIDSVINRAKTTGLFDDSEAITTGVVLPYRRANATTRHLLIARGEIGGMHTFTRLRDCSMSERDGELRVYGELGLTDYKFNYQYTTEYEGFGFAGNISAKIYRNTWMLEVIKRVGEKPAVILTADKVGDIEIDYSNLGSLTWLTQPLRKILTGHIKMETDERVRDFLEKRLHSAALQLPIIKDYQHRSQ